MTKVMMLHKIPEGERLATLTESPQLIEKEQVDVDIVADALIKPS